MGCSETHFIRTGRGEADERGGIVRRPSREVPTLRQPDVTKARIEAGKRLAIDPTVVVPCPVAATQISSFRTFLSRAQRNSSELCAVWPAVLRTSC